MAEVKSTNYYNTFIEVADDCPAVVAEIPPQKENGRTAANIQYDMISSHPYQYTSDDVLFVVYAEKNELTDQETGPGKEKFFSRGQPCFRSSPLTKRYGWGLHSNAEEKVALYALESDRYQEFLKDKSLKHVKAMRSKRGS